MNIIVKDVRWTPLSVKLVETRRVRLAEPIDITINTNCGVYRVHADMGFCTDGRSGGIGVDLLIPHYGDEANFLAFLTHDVLFQLQEYTFEFANDLLDAMLKYNGRWWLTRKLIAMGVSGSTARKAYNTQDKWDIANTGKAWVRWDDR